jgi:DNA-binding Lrp family transcriptional regulator
VQTLAEQRVCIAKNGGSLQIDDLDREIVAELVRDARQSYAAIGEHVGLSASAVKRRTDRLCRDGAVVGFSAVLNAEAAGANEAFVELYCQDPIAPESITRVLERHPQVIAAYIVSGEPDALVHLRSVTVAELDEVLEQIRAELRAERSRSSIVLAQLLHRPPSLSPDHASS